MVQSGVPAARLLEKLPQRPPTPPRESDNGYMRPGAPMLRRVLSKDLRSHTPPTSISSSLSSESVNIPSDKSQKKVTWTESRESPRFSSRCSTQSEQPLRLLPPSAERKPAKSILKPYTGVIAIDRSTGTKFGAPHMYPNFATMLESIAKQLAGEDRSSRLDAYMSLSSVLKASENIPDQRALKEKMGLLMQFIQRDMSAKYAPGEFDTVLINNSLILLSILIWKPACSECLTTEFCSYVVDHSINAFEDPLVSKDMVKHLLFVIGQQNFSAKVITSVRVGRIIEALNSIEDRVKGRSIILGRLTIYRKLLNQARMAMLANTSWIGNLCTDMTGSLKEIRATAVALGFDAALQLGAEKQASRAVMELFERDYDKATRYADHYAKRLSSMIRNKQEGASVPQIWSIILLFLRHHPQQLEYWEFMTCWLKIIQECFNKSDREVKLQANLAWNRLVFAVHPDEKTTPTMIKILGQALSGQLKRKPVGKTAKEERQMAIGSVCNLLYYALRPNATATQLDLYWDEYVVPLVGRMLVSTSQESFPTEQNDLAQACAIMGALLDATPKTWNNNRANENGVVRAEELPSIDARWIRKNVQRVFAVLEPLIEKCFTDFGNKESPISSVWKNFASSVASAGVKEVKVSNDTMTSVAFTFNMLYKIWLKGPNHAIDTEKKDTTLFCSAFETLVTTVIAALGILPFTEKLLSIGPQEIFAIVATPSHHPLKNRDVRSPLYHLFTLLARPPPELSCDENYFCMAKAIFHPFLDARKSRRSRIEFLNDLSQYITLSASSPSVSVILWQALASFATTYIKENEESASNNSGCHDQPPGVEYRNIVKVLELGIGLSPGGPMSGWTDLFMAILVQISLEAGEISRAISVIEPLAHVLQVISDEYDETFPQGYCSLLVSNAAYPRDRQSLDMARRRLWGTAPMGSKSSNYDPFLHFYTYLRQTLVKSYQILTDHSKSYIEILSSAAGLVKRCPAEIIVNMLKNVQEGVALWVLDEGFKYGRRKLPGVATCVATLWSTICSALKQLPRTDSNLLRILEPLLCSALESKHKSTVSATVTLWNSTFGGEAELEYPPRVREALLSLRFITDLQLPSFPNDIEEEAISTGPIFHDSQEDSMSEYHQNSELPRFSEIHDRDPRLNLSLAPLSGHKSMLRVTIEVPETVSRKRRRDGTPEIAKRKANKQDTTPKLRHDDSQIQFAPINSSPLIGSAIDSQLLTDRQKEVKERQRTEATSMFPDLRTSPKIGGKSGLCKLTLTSDISLVNRESADEPKTPTTLPPDKEPFDGFITSSPTPHRESAVIEPPSSPPEQSSAPENLDNLISSVESRMDIDITLDITDVTCSSHALPGEASCTSTELGPSAQVVDDLTSLPSFISFVESPSKNSLKDFHPQPTRDQGIPTADESIVQLAQDLQTPIDAFMDALSSPTSQSPTREMTSDEDYVDAVSSLQGESLIEQSVVRQGDAWARVSDLPNWSQPTSGESDSLRKSSYPISELDESSLLRLVTGFDGPDSQLGSTNSGDARNQILLPKMKNAHCALDPIYQDATTKPPLKESGQVEMESESSSFGCIVVTPINESSQTQENPSVHLTKSKTSRALRSSRVKSNTAVASTIPETPRKSLLADTIDNNIEASGSISRVKANDSAGNRASNRNRTFSRTPEKGGSTVSKRRIVGYEDTEVPDSQEAKTADSGPFGKKNKRQRKSRSPIKVDSSSFEVEEFGREPSVDLGMKSQSQESAAADGNTCGFSCSNENQETEAVEEVTCENPAAIEARNSIAPVALMSSRFRDILEDLRSAALKRDEAAWIENILWDIKGELYAAEKRGRQG